jgi:class 3 adenylate cyclase/tetratricopeptide (TPR) repeat protein
MKCPRCQAENPPGMRFCGQCAAPLAAACPSCGSANPPGNKFCGQCATPLDGSTRSRFASAETYTPQHLAERIINSKVALEGERKQVTVLFADLKGSMELLADRDPEEARKLLDPVIEHMMEAVHRYEGTVNQVMGDGIMALFGAPVAHEDHAIRACYASLRMQESVKRYAVEVYRAHGVPVRIRVGLNSGEVVVRSIGNDLHMDYTAIGQTTHLAARMEQIADPGTIRLTSDTLQLAEGFVQVQPLGPTPVKGLGMPVEVYELTGASPVRSRLQATAARGLTKFVGRDGEMVTVFAALEQARAGRGQVIAIVGEPGVGKSRLVWEVTHSHRAAGCTVLEATSVSYGRSATYLPVIDLLKRYAGIEPRDDGRKIREKVTGKLFSLDRALEPCLAPILWLLDAPVEDPAWERLDSVQRRQSLHEAVRRVLLRESREQPVLVVFEDLHWIDDQTQALLDGLVERLPTAALCLLTNYRPEYRHAWGSKTYYTQVRLDALPATSAAELLGALLGSDASVRPLVPVLIARTDGNPFFLEETVQTLAEAGALAGDRGGYRLVRTLEVLDIPATAQAILSARIDRLMPQDKRLLQTAAVIGKDVPYPLLRAIAGMDDTTLRAGLARLQEAEFLYEVQLFPELEHTFKHALTHEVAYGTLLGDRRRSLHAEVVKAIEGLFVDRLTEQIEPLAHHAFRGAVWEKASDYLYQAGAKVAGRSAYREAANYFERALESSRHLPSDQVSKEQTIELRFALRNALWPIGEFDRILTHLCEARDAAETLADQPKIGRAYSYLTQYYWMVGDYARAIEAGARAAAIGGALGDPSVQVPTNLHAGLAHHARGDYPTAIQTLTRNVTLLRGDLAREYFGLAALPSVYSRTWIAWSLAELGDFSEAIRRGREEVEIADAADHPLSRVNAYFGIGYVYLRQGALRQATDALENGCKLCQSLTVPFWLPVATSLLGHAYTLAGRLAEAIPLLEDAVERAATMNRRVDQALWSAHLSEAYLAVGRIENARHYALLAAELARRHGERGNEAHVLRLQAKIASHPDVTDIGMSEAAYRAAVALATELRMRPLVAHCHLGLGKLYRRTGKREQAQEHLTTATAMYLEMGMTYWLEKAETEMRERS